MTVSFILGLILSFAFLVLAIYVIRWLAGMIAIPVQIVNILIAIVVILFIIGLIERFGLLAHGIVF